MSRSLLTREMLMQLGWGMYKAEREEDRLAALAQRKAQYLKKGFDRCCNAERTGFVTEDEYVEMYRVPMLRYGIVCDCLFTGEEVEAYLRKQFAAMNCAANTTNISA